MCAVVCAKCEWELIEREIETERKKNENLVNLKKKNNWKQ